MRTAYNRIAEVLLAFAVAIIYSTARAADPGLEICTTLYSKGIIDQHNTLREEERYSFLHDLLVKEDFQSYGELSSWGAKAGIDLPLLDVVVGFSGEAKSSSNKFQEEFKRFRTESTQQAKSRLLATDSDSIISRTLLSVYQDCERNYFANVLATQKQIVIITPQNPPSSFLVHVAATFPQNGKLQALTINQIEPTGIVKCSISGESLKLPYTFPGTDGLIQCTKPVQSEIAFLLRTNAGVADHAITVPKAVSDAERLQSLVAALKAQAEASYTPIGTIIAFSGSLEDATVLRSRGWWVCDGTIVNDTASKWNLKATPDFRNKFIMGAGISVLPDQRAGASSFTIPDQSIGSHTTGGFGPPLVSGDPFTHMQGSHTWTTDLSIYSEGVWKGTTVPTLPPYVTLIYLLKVR